MKKILGGVYFLYDKGELVYIGKSNNIFYRIGTHIHQNIKEFDEWKYQEIDDEIQRTKTESYLISIYKPKYNQQIVESCEVDYHFLEDKEHSNSCENMRMYEDLYWQVDFKWLEEYFGFPCKNELISLIGTEYIPDKYIKREPHYSVNRKYVMDHYDDIFKEIIDLKKQQFINLDKATQNVEDLING